MDPNRQGDLNLPGQRVHWEEYGNPDGVPALYLHGGPGGSMGKRGWVRRFDPAGYRIVGFDQRGAGASIPLAGDPRHDLDGNTTQRLVEDIEALRMHLGVDAWVLNGVSWGATLALAYAQAHPERVRAIMLMAVTTTRAAEVEWISEGCRILYPEAWDRLAGFVERHAPGYSRGRGRLIDAIAPLLRDPDPDVRAQAALAWGEWEATHVSIGSGYAPERPSWSEAQAAIPFATLVTHYWSHNAFLDPPILDRMDRIADIPGWLVHGRRDVSGPADTAWQLHRRWPASRLHIVEDEGHGGPEMVRLLAAANAEYLSAGRP